MNTADAPNAANAPNAPEEAWDWDAPLATQNLALNLSVLGKRDPQLARKLEQLDSVAIRAAGIEAQRSKDGHWILVYQGRPLYSRYRPLEETQRWVAQDLRRECNAAIFAGFGLGYQMEEFLQHRSRAILLLVEASLELFKAALCLRDLRFLLGQLQFFWSIGPQANVEILLHRYAERSFQFYQLQALYSGMEDFYRPLQRRILSLLNRFRINTNTLNRFGQLWVRNIAMNLCFISQSNDVGIFFGRFSQFPFLLVAAGPSLEPFLARMPELKKRFVIVAVDTALRSLLAQGCQPDFVVSVDPQLLNARHYDHCESPGSILVSESCVHPLILRKPWRYRVLFHSGFPLMEQLERALSARGAFAQVRSGGSVATASWDFARSCGASSLYTVGLDLSYPSLRAHCRGTLSQRYGFMRGSRCQTIEQLNWRVSVSAGATYVPAWDGSQVLSDKRMTVYRNWLEESLKNHPQWPNYSIGSAHSAKIEGMECANWEQVLALPERRAEIDAAIQALLEEAQGEKQGEYQGEAQGDSAAPQTILPGLQRHAQALAQAMRDIYQWSGELLALFCYSRLSRSQEDRIQTLQTNISRSPIRNLVSFFFTETLSQVVGRSPQQEAEGQLERDRLMIYQQFYLSSKYHLYWLEMGLQSLKGSPPPERGGPCGPPREEGETCRGPKGR